MKSNPIVDRAPGQHEQLLAAVTRIEESLKKQIKIEIKCSCCADTQKEILGIVREILKRIQTGGGLTKEQEDKLAADLAAATNPLKDSVEANQPK